VDIHDFLFPYAASEGDYGKAQRVGQYHNEVDAIDADLKNAARTPDGPARQALYYDAEAKFYTLNSIVMILVPVGRGYQRVWDQDFAFQYNALMPGLYAYWLWKYLYWRGDVDYDGKVNMGDIVYILDAFASYIGKGGMPVIHPRWNFHCDVDGNPYESGPLFGDGGWRDRKIDMYDVGAALTDFAKSSSTWEIMPKVTKVGTTLTCTATGGNPAAYAYQWYSIPAYPAFPTKIPGANTNVYVAAPGNYACEVKDGIQASLSPTVTVP
jgi:hypothetical protein